MVTWVIDRGYSREVPDADPAAATAATEPASLSDFRRNRRAAARRAEILRSAAELFLDRGYEATTLEAVGEQVGLSAASLYYYVRSKEDLLAGILVDVLDRIEAQVPAAGDDDDPRRRLRALCRAHVRVTCSDASGMLIARQNQLRERATELAHTAGRYRHFIEGIVSDGIDAGVFRPVDLTTFGWSLMLTLNGTASWWTPEDPRTLDEVADEVLSYFLTGLETGAGAGAGG